MSTIEFRSEDENEYRYELYSEKEEKNNKNHESYKQLGSIENNKNPNNTKPIIFFYNLKSKTQDNKHSI